MSKDPFIIVGLGNPGQKYEKTRHNMGFMAIDVLAERNGIDVKKLKFKALIGDGRIAGNRVFLVKPQTYMNLSGDSVREIVNFYKIPIENLIVLYDDFDIDAGSIRIRKFGSAGTHNGMRSIVKQLGSDRFPRIRIGIGGQDKGDLVDFVIGGMSKKEAAIHQQTVEDAAIACEGILKEGLDRAMNRYNVRKPKESNE